MLVKRNFTLRNLLLVIFFTALCNISFGQTTYTSSQDGAWLNKTTWTPVGVPTPSDPVIIKHVVTVSSATVRTASTEINTSGKLIINEKVAFTIAGTWSSEGIIENYGKIILGGPGSFPGINTTIDVMKALEIDKIGTISLDKGFLISDSLILKRGYLEIGNFKLKLDSKAVVGGNPGSSSLILTSGEGKVAKMFSEPGTFTYPVGDNISRTPSYSPATITLHALSNWKNTQIEVNVKRGKHTQNTSLTNYLNRYWNIVGPSKAEPDVFIADAQFKYVLTDVVGDETKIITAGYSGPNWYLYNMSNTTSKILSFSGQKNLNNSYTGGDNFSPLATSPNSHFKSSGSGEWNNNSKWLSSPDGINNWLTSTLFPSSEAKSILIQSGHTVKIPNIQEGVTAKLLTIETGSTLDNVPTTGGRALTIYDDGTSSSDFNIYGTYILYGRKPTLDGDATATVYTGGLVQVNENHKDLKNSDEFAQSVKVHFNSGSIFDWNTTDPFKTSAVTYFPNSEESTIPVFRVSKEVHTSTGIEPAYINGLFIVNDRTTLGGTGTKYFRNGISGSSTLTQASSQSRFVIQNENAILGGSNLNLQISSIMYLEKSAIIPMDSTIKISGSGIENKLGILTVNGTFDVTDQQITNPNAQIKISGTFRSKNTGNTTWPLISVPSGIVELLPGSTIELYGEGDQTFKSRDDFSNLVFSGSGTKTPSSGFGYNGVMTIKDEATFDAKNYTIGDIPGSHLRMTGGRYITTSASTNPTIKGTYDLSGGVIEFGRTDLSTYQSVRDETFNKIEVTGNNVRNSDGNIMLRDNGSFTIKDEGIFTINTNSIKPVEGGTASVIVESKGRFKTGNNQGFHGHNSEFAGGYSSIHANITDITLETGSTVEYSRDAAKHTGDGSQEISNANNLAYQNLVLSGSGNKTAPSDTLFIKGDFEKSTASVFVHNNGTVEFTNKKEPPQEYNSKEYTSVTPFPEFFNLVNNQNLKINSDLSVKNTLTLGEKSILNLAAGDITIASDESGTAKVAEIPTDASITYGTGRFKVERFIPKHHHAWQLLSVPTYGGTIKESWQDNKNNTIGKGVNITGPLGNNTDLGFDRYSPAPSMKFYNPATNLFEGVSSTHNIISDYPAYFLFVRGDRSANAIGDPSSDVTIHTRGKLYYPGEKIQVPTVTVKPGKWALAGNPYASAIDFYSLSLSSNLETGYYIWDANLTSNESSQYGMGAYRRIEIVERELVAVPEGDAEELYGEGNVPTLQSGQAFFVKNASESQSGFVAFSENAKTTGSSNIFRVKKNESVPSAKIKTNLFVNTNGENILLDGTLHLFGKEYSEDIDRFDAKKMINSGENISLPSNKYPLIVERRPFPNEGDTLFYNLSNMSKRNYSLDISLSEIEEGSHEVYLNDGYLNSSTQLANGNNRIEFIIDNNSASAKKDRFYLTFKKIILPLTFKNETAVTIENNIVFSWETINQQNVEAFVTEHSRDGQQFRSLQNLYTANVENDSYEYNHKEPDAGTHYYRAKAVMKDGSVVYSKLVSASIEYTSPSISVFPNPVKDYLQLKYNRQQKGIYGIRLLNSEGKQMISTVIHHSEPTGIHKINLYVLSAGFYQLEITKPDGTKYSEKIIVR